MVSSLSTGKNKLCVFTSVCEVNLQLPMATFKPSIHFATCKQNFLRLIFRYNQKFFLEVMLYIYICLSVAISLMPMTATHLNWLLPNWKLRWRKQNKRFVYHVYLKSILHTLYMKYNSYHAYDPYAQLILTSY